MLVKKLGVIFEPTKNDFEQRAVLNPGVWREGNKVHLFYRAIDRNNLSSIGYALLEGPTKLVKREKKPVIERKYKYESKGVEDPRIVKIGKTFYLFYVAHDGKNALTAYCTSQNLKTFKRRGIITPKITYHRAEKILREAKLKDSYFFHASVFEEHSGKDVLFWLKDTFLFPRKIKGKFFLITRVLPDIQIMSFDNFKELKTEKFWERFLKNLPEHVILENRHWFETRHIGGGAPPVETDEGWLLIFHSVEETNKERTYHTSAALLDKENPFRVIGRLHQPLFSPAEEWEKTGLTPNVVFATGTAVFGDNLYIYYGAADSRVAVARVSLKELVETLKSSERICPYCSYEAKSTNQ